MSGKRRVLIVDDNAETVDMVRILLQRAGLRVFDAGTCAEAMTCCDGEPIDVLVTDRRLPDGDGMGLLERLSRNNPQLQGIICSGADSGFTDDSWRTAGYLAYMHKPIDFEHLLTLVVGQEAGPFQRMPI